MYKSVANQIQFNTQEDYEKFKATFCSRGQVDFNKIIAMPAVVRDYDPFVDACLVLYLARENKNIKFYGAEDDKLSQEEYDAKYIDKNGVKLAEKYMLSEDKVKKSFAILDSQEMSKLDCDKIGEQAFLAEQKFGQIDFISWSIENWGTKWNALNTEFFDETNTVRFDTAWTKCQPIIRAIARKGYAFKYEYAHQNYGSESGCQLWNNKICASSVKFDEESNEALETWGKLFDTSDSLVYLQNQNKVCTREDLGLDNNNFNIKTVFNKQDGKYYLKSALTNERTK